MVETIELSDCRIAQLPGWFSRLRISMDRISDSDSEDAGSIPAGATTEQSKETKTA